MTQSKKQKVREERDHLMYCPHCLRMVNGKSIEDVKREIVKRLKDGYKKKKKVMNLYHSKLPGDKAEIAELEHKIEHYEDFINHIIYSITKT